MRTFDLLEDCLVEGDALSIARRRRSRRMSLILSVTVQVGFLSLLLLVPLFARTERVNWKLAVPIPPYKGYRQQANRQEAVRREARPPADQGASSKWGIVEPPSIPQKVYDGPVGEEDVAVNNHQGAACPLCDPNGLIPLDPKSAGPSGPPPPAKESGTKHKLPVRVSESVQQALLIHRVQPKYPPLALQMRMEGRVELRAIIGRDGTINSLEVLSGHPLFLRETQEATRQWRYQPTLLNGEPVEVETRITVIFTLQR